VRNAVDFLKANAPAVTAYDRKGGGDTRQNFAFGEAYFSLNQGTNGRTQDAHARTPTRARASISAYPHGEHTHTVRGVGIHARFGRRLLSTTFRRLPLRARHDAEERRMSEFSGPGDRRTNGRMARSRDKRSRQTDRASNVRRFVARNVFPTIQEFFLLFRYVAAFVINRQSSSVSAPSLI